MGSSYTRSTARRVSAALIVLAWLGGLVLGVVHAHEEAHRYCAEHGTFEEVHEGADSQRGGGLAVHAADQGEGSHGDEACAFHPLPAPALAALAPAVAAPAPALLPAAPVVLVSIDVAPIAILHLAPKSSPPFVAFS